MENKKGIITDYLGYIILAVAILVLLIIGMIVLKSKGISALEYIKNLFRFKR